MPLDCNSRTQRLLFSTSQNGFKKDFLLASTYRSMPYYFPASGLPTEFRSSYIPSTYVVSREGRVIYRKEGLADYSSDSFREWLIEEAQAEITTR